WRRFEACRRDQRGPFTRRLAGGFVGDADVAGVIDRARELWEYPPETLLPDVRPTLEALHGRYRLGVLANQERWIRDTMARDGLDRFFELWAVSAEIGADKPDRRIFEHALAEAGTTPDRCAMVGDRLDNDVRASRSHGMKAVWLLRGEAPDDPTPAQLAEADAAVHGLDELPDVLRRL
ncbi:MAG TPA: HAD-IA family hydrolase, partial [Actinomycetota bacterium]|nr:HAD-IA family hydrolase [Actinomycetota bacterium]